MQLNATSRSLQQGAQVLPLGSVAFRSVHVPGFKVFLGHKAFKLL